MVILDTNIIIDHLRQPLSKSILVKVVEKERVENLGISILTIQELFEGKSTRDEVKKEYLLEVIKPLTLFDYNFEVAQKAGELARDLSFDIEFADVAIAATAIMNEHPLLTLNKKHFRNIPKLTLFDLV